VFGLKVRNYPLIQYFPNKSLVYNVVAHWRAPLIPISALIVDCIQPTYIQNVSGL